MATIRIRSALLRPDGKVVVEASLADGSIVNAIVEGSIDPKHIARQVAMMPSARPMLHVTGNVELDDAEYAALRAQATEPHFPVLIRQEDDTLVGDSESVTSTPTTRKSK